MTDARSAVSLASIPMACNVSQALDAAVRARAIAEGLTMPEAQRAALQAWAGETTVEPNGRMA